MTIFNTKICLFPLFGDKPPNSPQPYEVTQPNPPHCSLCLQKKESTPNHALRPVCAALCEGGAGEVAAYELPVSQRKSMWL